MAVRLAKPAAVDELGHDLRVDPDAGHALLADHRHGRQVLVGIDEIDPDKYDPSRQASQQRRGVLGRTQQLVRINLIERIAAVMRGKQPGYSRIVRTRVPDLDPGELLRESKWTCRHPVGFGHLPDDTLADAELVRLAFEEDVAGKAIGFSDELAMIGELFCG